MNENNVFKTPILLIVFNRVDTLKRIVGVLREVNVTNIYISADGPREKVESDFSRTKAVRDYISENINWKCEIKTRYSDINMGCKKACSSALRWFFENEENGIILEDDCLPDKSFFSYCEELLDLYKDDQRVGMISGYNASIEYPFEYSYHFATGGSIWGWATWRRVAKDFDPEDKLLRNPKIRDFLLNATTDINETEHILAGVKRILDGEDDNWDFSWSTILKINSQLSIVPSVNMIRNIGINPDATHPIDESSKLFKVEAKRLSFPMEHPPCMVADRKLSMKMGALHYPVMWKRILLGIPFFRVFYKCCIQPILKKIKTNRIQ